MITAEVSIYVRVTDTLALAHAAAQRAVADGSHQSEDEYLAEFPVEEIENHLRMLLDPGGSTPEGVEILDSACEVQEDAA
jgi:hypothetical protein